MKGMFTEDNYCALYVSNVVLWVNAHIQVLL